MAKLPYARIMEVAWTNWFLPPKRNSMLDIMGGTGFVSNFMSPFFEKAVILDESKDILPPSSSKCISITGDATKEVEFEKLANQYDLAINLGGFHHITAVSENATENIVNSWSNTLNQNGRLIIADVPFQGQSANSKVEHNGHEPEISEILNILPKWKLPQTTRHFTDWCLSLRSATNNMLHKEPEPADFFDHVVAKLCPNGHEANFRDVEILKKVFCNLGLKNVSGFVLLTPWLFEDRRQAAWFINELFAFGDQAFNSPEVFPQDKVDEVMELIKNYLGYAVLNNGTCVTGWKLMVVMGDRA
jgi:protein-L-isoaspartate O-methyltransferase